MYRIYMKINFQKYTLYKYITKTLLYLYFMILYMFYQVLKLFSNFNKPFSHFYIFSFILHILGTTVQHDVMM